MKLTIEQTQTKTIDLPLYFRINGRKDQYFMTVGNKSAIEVYNLEMGEDLYLYPLIRIIPISDLKYSIKTVEPISETVFKNAYIKASLEIEKLMN